MAYASVTRIPLGEFAAGGARVQIDPKDMEVFMASLAPKQISKAILRAADVAVGMWVTVAGNIMDREEPPYMVSRRKGILAEYRRQSVRMRGRWEGSVARSRTTAMGGAAAALEVGGTYEQWVHSYKRMMTFRGSRGETGKTRHQTVGEHRRTRTERKAKHYLGRAMVMVGNIWDVPLQRAIESVFAHGKVPGARSLRRGLLGGL